MQILSLAVVAFAAGYVTSVYTWDKLHTFIIGAKQKAEALRAKARELEAKLRGK